MCQSRLKRFLEPALRSYRSFLGVRAEALLFFLLFKLLIGNRSRRERREVTDTDSATNTQRNGKVYKEKTSTTVQTWWKGEKISDSGYESKYGCTSIILRINMQSVEYEQLKYIRQTPQLSTLYYLLYVAHCK